MLSLLRNKRIPKILQDRHDIELIYIMAKELNPIEQGFGDCIESDFDPSGARQCCYDKGILLIIRQISMTKWRIWRKK